MSTQLGRPKKNKPLSEIVNIRIEPLEKIAFKEAADIAGVPLSIWMRERLRRSSIKELEEMGRPIPFLKDFSL